MRRVAAISAVFLLAVTVFLGCSRRAVKKDDDDKQVQIDPKKVQIDPPIQKNTDPPQKKVAPKIDDKQEKYEAALGDALSALAERKWNDAYVAFKTAQKFDDTAFVRAEIARLKDRVDQDVIAKNAVKNIEGVLDDGNADDAAKLAGDALKEFGDGDDAERLVELRIQAEAIKNAEKKETAAARFARFKKEGDLAVEEKNLRAAALAYEQALDAQGDADLKTTAAGIRAKVDEYDALRKQGIELRKDGLQIDDALAAFQGAAAAWDTLQIRADIDDCRLALARRRDVVAVADFELRNDVGIPGAGGMIAEELLPRLKPKFDLVERAQLQAVLGELKVQPGFHDDPKQQRQIGRVVKARYLVVGSVQRLVGVTVRARLVDVQTGLVAQTGKIVALDMDDAIKQIPDLARQLMMTDEAKAKAEEEAQQAAKVIAKAPDNAPLPALPQVPAADAPPPAPPLPMVNPAPPVFVDVRVAAFKNFAPQPDVLVAPPIDPLGGQLRGRLLFAAIERGDALVLQGRFREANRQFEFALTLAPDNAGVIDRLNLCRPFVPPAPIDGFYRPRLAVLPFMTFGNPFTVPPYLSSWTPQNLSPYFSWRYDVADPAEIYWYMGRMGLTMNDLLIDPNARRWLGRATGVRYFVFGNCIETTSFDVNTFLIDAEYGYQVGGARINVRDVFELKLRLPELAQLTMMTPAEQAAYQQARLVQLIYDGQQQMSQRRYRAAVDDFQKALAIDPYNVQALFLLQQANSLVGFEDFEQRRREQYDADRARWDEQRRRRRELEIAGDQARRRAAAEEAARNEAERRSRLTIRIDAMAGLGTRAQLALQAGNFRFSLALFRGQEQLSPPPAVVTPVPVPTVNYQSVAQARLRAEQAERVRVAEFTAVREKAIREVREQQLAKAQQDLAKEKAIAQKEVERLRTAQTQRDDQGYQASLKQGQQLMTQQKYDAALAAFQAARRFKQTDQVQNLIDIVTQRQAEARSDKAALVRLEAERDRRKAAETQAKQKDDTYQTTLAAAQSALAAKNYEVAQTKFQEAGKLFKTDAVLNGLKQIDAARAAQLAEAQKAETEKKRTMLVKQLVSDGQAALAGKKYTDAIRSFQQAKKLAPDNLDALAGLSQAELAQQRLAQLTKDPVKDKTPAVDPTAADKLKLKDYLATAQAALKTKDYDAAEKAFRAAGQIDAKNPAVVQGLQDIQSARQALADQKQRQADYQAALAVGQKALSGKDYPAAIKSFQQALKLMPDDMTASKLLQQAQLAQGAADKTAVGFQTAMDAGKKAMAAKDYKTAVKAYTEATTLNPTDAAARTALAQARQALVDADTQAQILANYQKAMSAGQTALNGKKYGDAVKSFKDALKFVPNDQKATQQLAQAQQLLTDSSKIKTPPEPSAFDQAMQRGAAAEKNQKYADAAKAYQEALKLQPKSAPALTGYNKNQFSVHLNQGQQYLDNMMWLQAQTEFESALRIFPGNPQATKLLQKAKNKGK